MSEKLFVNSREDILTAARIITEGGIGAMDYNGPYGIVGSMHDPLIAEKICEIKGRDYKKTLVAIFSPESLEDFTDVDQIPYPINSIKNLLVRLHALGLILPASVNVPEHLIVNRGEHRTVLEIYTKFLPLDTLLAFLRQNKVDGLVATSANRSGEGTFTNPDELFEELGHKLDFVLYGDRHRHLPERRKRSTSIVDILHCEGQDHRPRLFRLGNTTQKEIDEVLSKLGLPSLKVDTNTLIVHPRKGRKNLATAA